MHATGSKQIIRFGYSHFNNICNTHFNYTSSHSLTKMVHKCVAMVSPLSGLQLGLMGLVWSACCMASRLHVVYNVLVHYDHLSET